MKRGLVALGALLLTGCGGLDINMAGFETELGAAIAEEVDADPSDITVECPNEIDWDPGNTFRCFVTDDAGTKAKVTIYMENNDGEYTWEIG